MSLQLVAKGPATYVQYLSRSRLVPTNAGEHYTDVVRFSLGQGALDSRSAFNRKPH